MTTVLKNNWLFSRKTWTAFMMKKKSLKLKMLLKKERAIILKKAVTKNQKIILRKNRNKVCMITI